MSDIAIFDASRPRLNFDREYPGAPDRGGKERDTDNFVALLKTLRQTFDAQNRELGLTFTAPSSVRASQVRATLD